MTKYRYRFTRSKTKGIRTLIPSLKVHYRPITIAELVNSFERSILKAYDKCSAAEALRKYFSTLTDKDIKHLLEDNYLIPLDLRKVLKKNRL
jgi:hypothetical protein